jgi:hypothetical protein
MPDIHVPHLDEEQVSSPEAVVKPRRRWNSVLRVGLEVALITTGVFLGLAGEQWRENAHHRELSHASLLRFRAEFQANRAEVLRVRDRHAKELKDLQAYLNSAGDALTAHIVDPRKPIPTPVPDTVTDSAGVDYGAWDFSLATQSLAYIDPELVASMSAAYRMQEIYQQAHRAIQQTSYSFTDPVYFIRGVTFYFDDAVLYEELLLKRYDDILGRLDRAIANK